ncbi:MAG: terminase large subunit domain-containing protein [Candidatus Nanopelagicaceae bacterium]
MSKRKGSTLPRLSNAPLKGRSRIDEVLPWLEQIGQELLPWQKHVLTDMLKVNKDGNFIRKTNLLLVSRQAGKTHLARIRILAGLYLFGEKSIVAMSSNRAMALDTFRKVCDLVEETPLLRTQLKQIRVANGQESLELLNGARYEIVAATRDGSRGKTADLLFVDEVREISEEAWTAARPITRARPNSQIFMCSNAGDSFSQVLNDLRQRALSYPPKSLGFWEYSAPDFCDIWDKDGWYQANPALGYLVDEETIAEAIATSSVEATRTETLCQWITALRSPFPHRAFEDLTVQDLQIMPGRTTIFAIDIAVTKRDASLVAAQQMDNGKIAVGVIAQFHSDTAVDELKIAAEVNDWAKKYRPRLICFDKYTTASVAERLSLSGQKTQDMSGQIFYQACSDLLDSIVNQRLIHSGQKSLVDSMNNCAAKETDAGWRIVRRKSAGDVSAAIALAMCIHQIMKPQTKPQIISA